MNNRHVAIVLTIAISNCYSAAPREEKKTKMVEMAPAFTSTSKQTKSSFKFDPIRSINLRNQTMKKFILFVLPNYAEQTKIIIDKNYIQVCEISDLGLSIPEASIQAMLKSRGQDYFSLGAVHSGRYIKNLGFFDQTGKFRDYQGREKVGCLFGKKVELISIYKSKEDIALLIDDKWLID